MDKSDEEILEEKYKALIKAFDAADIGKFENNVQLASYLNSMTSIKSIQESQKTQFWIKWATIVMALTSIANLIITLFN